MIIFKEFVDDLRIKFQKIATVTAEKEISYGHQLTCERDGERALVSVYYNKKNQFRIVWPTNKNQLCLDLMAEVGVLANRDEDFNNIWAGSDESGKGDFFGPLVVAAVVLNKEIATELLLAGVKDCKEMTDKKVLELEPFVIEKALAFSVLELTPKQYNYRYTQLKNLNTLNASVHFHALKDVLEQVPEAEGALIDQFLNTDIIIRELHKIFPEKKFLQRPKAEENTAVAAASLLARARFLHSMDLLAKKAGLNSLPKGSGPVQAGVAREISNKFGKDILVKFVKTHFSTYKDI